MSLHLPLKGRFHEALHDHMGEALGALHPVEQARGHSLINRRPEFRELVNVDAVRLVLTFGVFRRSHHVRVVIAAIRMAFFRIDCTAEGSIAAVAVPLCSHAKGFVARLL